MKEWYKNLPVLLLSELIGSKEIAEYAFVFSADMINDFCKPSGRNSKKRPLASDRVGAIAQPIIKLFSSLHGVGVENFILVQDWHDPEAKEFKSFPPHAVRDTEGAKTISEFSKLPFADEFIIFRKNAISPAGAYREKRHKPYEKTHPIYPEGYNPVLTESFDKYLENNDIRIAIVVGNCTDLCVRELAMYILMWANEHQKDIRVIIPANCVETFDLPFETAEEIGAMPHPGDVHQARALYEMARNNIDIVKEIV